jgi:hypothetical protein
LNTLRSPDKIQGPRRNTEIIRLYPFLRLQDFHITLLILSSKILRERG